MRDSKYYQIDDIYPFLKNPDKYKGTRPISMRSGWEISFVLKYLDTNTNIIEWGSESKIIKYISPVDGKSHRYFLDFNFKAKTKSGAMKEFWVEIKPFAQTKRPEVPKRNTSTYAKKVQTYLVNIAKWETTKQLIEQKNMEGNDIQFMVLTEKDCPFFLN